MSEAFYKPESLKATDSIGFLIKRCGMAMTRLAERRFEAQSISFTQWQVLIWLAQRPHASPTELSTHMGHDMGALTRVVDELVREGKIRRDHRKEDRRAVDIAITPEGRRAALAGRRITADFQNELVASYSKAEVDLLISMLRGLLLRMQDSLQPSTAISSQRRNHRSARASLRPRSTHSEPKRKARKWQI